MSQNISIYDRDTTNIKQLSIDSLPYRKKVNARKIFYLKPASRKCKCMHITQDYHDRAKHLTTMDLHKVNKNEQTCYYYIDIENKQIVKLKEYLNKHKKIDSKLVYHGIKSQALKKLKNMI